MRTDGKMEAVPLKDGSSRRSDLFKASDAPSIDEQALPTTAGARYVTDGPELYRTKDEHLLMLWSSYEHLNDKVPGGHYVQTLARSESGELKGPWVQLAPLVRQDQRTWHAISDLRWAVDEGAAPAIQRGARKTVRDAGWGRPPGSGAGAAGSGRRQPLGV